MPKILELRSEQRVEIWLTLTVEDQKWPFPCRESEEIKLDLDEVRVPGPFKDHEAERGRDGAEFDLAFIGVTVCD